MARIKSLFNEFLADRPRFFLTCFKFFLMFLFWIAFYFSAFTAVANDVPNRFNVGDLAGVGSAFVLIWWILTLAFLALVLLRNDKGVKIVGILQIALAVIYLGIIMLVYSNVAKELAGNPDATLSYSFGFWLMVVLLGLFVVSAFFSPLLDKLLVRVVPERLLKPIPAVAPAPTVEPQPEAQPAPMKDIASDPAEMPVPPAPAPEPEPVVEPVVEPVEVPAPAEPVSEAEPVEPIEPSKPES